MDSSPPTYDTVALWWARRIAALAITMYTACLAELHTGIGGLNFLLWFLVNLLSTAEVASLGLR